MSRVAPTRDITLTRREERRVAGKPQKSSLETSAGSRPRRLPPPESVKREINETNYRVAATTALSEELVRADVTIHVGDHFRNEDKREAAVLPCVRRRV